MHDAGPLLVIAGAGSGKTRTLVYRVARLILDGADPSSILLLLVIIINISVVDVRKKKKRGKKRRRKKE